MDKITQINVEGHNYGFVAGQAVKGVSGAAASEYVKIVILPEGSDIVEGMLIAVTFVNGNTAGFSGTKTVYSSNGTDFYWDDQLTDPITLPPQGCYTMTLISGQQYEYSAFPVLSMNGVVLPLCDSKGHPSGGPLWNSGDMVTFLYLDEKFVAVLSSGGTDIKVYTTLADAEADLNNLSEGDIVGTEQGGDGAVDAVTAGDYRLVTSNAVAVAIAGLVSSRTLLLDLSTDTNHICKIYGITIGTHKMLWFHFSQFMAATFTQGAVIGTLPEGWRPIDLGSGASDSGTIRTLAHCGMSSERRGLSVEVQLNGDIKVFVLGSPTSGSVTITGIWGDCYPFIS